MISVYKSNYKDFAKLHKEAVIKYCERRNNTKYKKNRLDLLVYNYFYPFVTNLEELIIADAEKLFKIKVYYDSLTQIEQDEIYDELDLLGLYTLFTNKKSPFIDFNGELYNSDVLSKKINISTCPYCNENTTYSFWHKKNNHLRRTFDWDHIIPKETYPFLAISYFNLVPACKVCNHLKLDKIINVSPHSNFDPDKTYNFQVSGNTVDFISNSNSINLLLKIRRNSSGSAIKEVIGIIGLDTRLDTQKELIADILNKKRIYLSAYWESIEKIIGDNNPINASEIKELFFSTYFNPDDYFRRSFSKLTHDILTDSSP